MDTVERLNRTFFALSDPTRRAMLSRLARGEASVGELSAPFDLAPPTISKHIKVLERAGLVRRQRDGRILRSALDPAPLRGTAEWLENVRELWETRFLTVDRLLRSRTRNASRTKRRQP